MSRLMNTIDIPLTSYSNSKDAVGSRQKHSVNQWSEALDSGTCLATALAVYHGQDMETFWASIS